MFSLHSIRLLVAAVALSVGASAAHAQAKIAIINLQEAILKTAEITKAQKELEAKYKPRQDKMEALQKELQTIQQQLQTMAGKLTPQAEQDLNISGQRKQRELQRITDDLQGDVDRERQDILGRSAKRMNEVVAKMAEAQSIDLVIDVTNTFYHKPALEITKDSIAEYDKTFPVK